MKVHLVHGTFELFRAHFGVPPARDAQGRPVGALRGILPTLLSLLREPDRFRMEWMWTGQYADKIKVAIFTNDRGTIALLMPQIAGKLNKIQIAENHRLGTPWVGVYKKLTTPE